MQFENYTDRARGLIQAAQTIALRENHQQFTPEHLLKALLDDQEGLAANLIRAAGGKPEVALQRTDEALAKLPQVEGGGQIYMAPPTAKVFAAAEEVGKKAGDKFVTAERLLTALAIEQSAGTSAILKEGGRYCCKAQRCHQRYSQRSHGGHGVSGAGIRCAETLRPRPH